MTKSCGSWRHKNYNPTWHLGNTPASAGATRNTNSSCNPWLWPALAMFPAKSVKRSRWTTNLTAKNMLKNVGHIWAYGIFSTIQYSWPENSPRKILQSKETSRVHCLSRLQFIPLYKIVFCAKWYRWLYASCKGAKKNKVNQYHKREVHITFTQRRGHGQTYRFSNNEFDCTPCRQIGIATDYKVSPAYFY